MQTSIHQQIAALHQMTVKELRQRYADVYGEATRAHSKPHMIRKIAWRIQALAEGELSERARQRAAELANDADVRIVPPRAKEDANSLLRKTNTCHQCEPPPAASSPAHRPRGSKM
jgi:hypothetical protein